MKTLEEIRPLAALGNVIPLYKEFLTDLDTPITALLKLKHNGKLVFLLESMEVGEKLARYSFLGKDPLYIFKAKGDRLEIAGKQNRVFQGKALEELQTFLSAFKGVDDPALPPFSGGAVGFITYDAVRLVENIPATGRDDFHLPDFQFGIYESFLVFDHLRHKLLIVSNVMAGEHASLEAAYASALEKILALEKELAGPVPPQARAVKADRSAAGPVAGSAADVAAKTPTAKPAAPEDGMVQWESNFTRAAFEAAVNRCKEYIRAGDAFQIVPSQRFTGRPAAGALDIYRALRTINPSPYMYYLDYGDFEIAGASPETLVKVQGRAVETKPIAGTRRRGKDEAEDQALEKELLADAKEKAEHLMLVDLGRNDIGRISEFGSVKVSQFMGVERLSHVMHIVSVVRGKLLPNIHPLEALMSCLPAGTLSGAPKIRAMEIIDELEPNRRGLYGGAICYMDFRGNLDSCIAIRTMVMRDGKAFVQAGGGIVADSDPAAEYEETRAKARALMHAVELAGRL